MPVDYQKQEAKQCLWDQDGQHTKKRWRNRGKGRGKEKSEIRKVLEDIFSGDDRDRQIEWEKEIERALDCYYYGPCEVCLAHEQYEPCQECLTHEQEESR